MNKKFAVAVLIALVASLLVSTSAFANFDAVSGQLKDGKTGSNWTYGGTATVYDCSNMNVELGSTTADSTGAFTVTMTSSGTSGFLCIKATFNAVDPNPASDPYWKVFQDSGSGTLDAGIFYTNTGPTAVALKEVTAQPSVSNIGLPVALLGVVVVAAAMLALGLVLRKRTAKA
jgi:hypothetical protein